MAAAAFAMDVGEPAAVGRGCRPDRAARPAGDLDALAAGHFVALDREHLLVRILGIFERVARRRVAAEIDVAAVGGEGRFAQLLLELGIGPLDQGLARAAAADIVEPDLAGTQRALGGEMLARRDEAAVRAPGRIVQEGEGLGGDGAGTGAVDVHHPDIVAAATVRGEGELAAVGREARLHVEGEAGSDPGRPAAGDRHGVEVAEQVEGDRPPVRADVDVHPGAFGNIDRNLAQALAGRSVDVPFRLLAAAALGENGGGGEQKRERGKAMDHDVENPGKTDVRKAVTVHYPGETGKRGKDAIRAFRRTSGQVRPAASEVHEVPVDRCRISP